MARKPARKKKTTRKAATKKRGSTKRTTRKKATAKKTTRKKATAKKPARKAKKKTTAKKTSGKKAAAKKTTARKPAAKKPAAKAAVAQKPVVKKVKKASKPKNGRTLAYTQSEFIENVRSYCGLEKRSQAKELCEDIADFIMDSLKKGYRVPLMGLGKMYVRKSKARMGRNPATGEPIQIPAKKRVRFSVAKALKDSVL